VPSATPITRGGRASQASARTGEGCRTWRLQSPHERPHRRGGRSGRERLSRYGARPPLSLERLRGLPGGRLSDQDARCQVHVSHGTPGPKSAVTGSVRGSW